jgi:IMP dehydrogenase
MKSKDHLLHNDSVLNGEVKISTDDVLLQPRAGVLKSRSDADIDFTYIYSSPMDTVTGLEFAKTFLELNQAPVFCRYLDEKHLVTSLELYSSSENYWFSVGASITYFSFLNDWIKINKPNASINISVDVAHGDMVELYKVYNKYSNVSWCNNLMSGTVATYKSAYNVYRAGCSHIRVGMGPGSASTTRTVTGCGVPNLSAVYETWFGFYTQGIKDNVTIIADGGIRNTGDAVKYLSAGADAIMLGNLLSKTVESHGWKESKLLKFFNKISFGTLFKNQYRYKNYRGKASESFQQEFFYKKTITHIEGEQGVKQYPETTLNQFVTNFNNSIASSLSYLGLFSIRDLSPLNVKFIKVSNNSLKDPPQKNIN